MHETSTNNYKLTHFDNESISVNIYFEYFFSVGQDEY
ncbi:Uncharacterised protein [Legionella oakridgensis]|nr:Uncharacterised protein [Legionella oakridgensis]